MGKHGALSSKVVVVGNKADMRQSVRNTTVISFIPNAIYILK